MEIYILKKNEVRLKKYIIIVRDETNKKGARV